MGDNVKPEKCPRCGAGTVFLQPADIDRFYPMWACRDCGHVFQSPPPADRSALCTTDGRSPEDARASQTNETGQHPSYIVLCDSERAKGFVRPYRDRYKHTACGGVTTMGRSLSETYARDPGFYGATFCCQCNAHYPVAEFVWTADGAVVGS